MSDTPPLVWLRVAAALMTPLFAFSAAVQWNDPDPVLWMGLYLTAMTLSALAAAGRIPLIANLAGAGIFAGFFLVWAPALSGARGEAFTSIEMRAPGDEEPREAIGLAIGAAWLGVQSAAAWRRRRR
jgi:hypothetical protein